MQQQQQNMQFLHRANRLDIVKAIVAVAVLSASAAHADSTVSFFRADAGLAGASAGPLPERFDAPETLVWRVRLDSGHSTPVLHSGKIFLTTFHAGRSELATLALAQDSGEILWKRIAPVSQIEPFHSRTGNPAAPTPACDGERVYVFFGSYGLLCYDLEGKLLWDHPMGPFQEEFGAGSSPILVDNKVIVSRDQDVNSFIMAIDRYTGQTIWKTERPAAVRSYSTPVHWTGGGRNELLLAGALELTSYDPDNGEKLWWVQGLARIAIPVPVPASDLIYMASWSPGADGGSRISLEPWEDALAKWDKNSDGKLARAELDHPEVLSRFYRMDLDQDGYLDEEEWDHHSAVFELAQNAVLALKPDGLGELTESALLWSYQRGIPYVASPLVDNGILWMVRDGGIVTKLDAATGDLLHQERLPGFGNYYASPVAGDGKVYFAGELGVLSVIANQSEWNVISSHDFKERIYATPVIHQQQIFIRTEEALYLFQGKTSAN